jgi:hypothetical protein
MIPASRHPSSRQRHPVRKLTSRWTVVAPQRLRAVTFFPLGVRMVCQWRLSRDTLTHTHAWWNYRRRSMTMKILVGPLLNFLQCLPLGIRRSGSRGGGGGGATSSKNQPTRPEQVPFTFGSFEILFAHSLLFGSGWTQKTETGLKLLRPRFSVQPKGRPAPACHATQTGWLLGGGGVSILVYFNQADSWVHHTVAPTCQAN